MIHSMPALSVGNPAHAAGGKTGKGGIEAAIVAMFSEALATQLKAGDTVTAAAAALPSGQPGMALDTQAALDGEALQANADPVLAEGALLAKEDAVAELLPDAGQPVAVLPGVVLADTAPEDAGDKADEPVEGGGIPAAAKNPRVLAGLKDLPLRPAVSANHHAYDAKFEAALPPGIQKLVGSTEAVDLRGVLQSSEVAGRALGAVTESLPEGLQPVQAQLAMAGMKPTAQMESQVGVRQFAQLATPMTQPQWQAEFGDKITWMAVRQGQMAELSLTPPSLGSIEVRLNVSGQEAGAQFFSANPVVREAIEAALPRLREMMAEAGLALGQAMVSSESFREREAQKKAEGSRGEGDADGGQLAGLQEAAALRAYRRLGLVDEFA
jgi:flagellar hook-length control protein FliK